MRLSPFLTVTGGLALLAGLAGCGDSPSTPPAKPPAPPPSTAPAKDAPAAAGGLAARAEQGIAKARALLVSIQGKDGSFGDPESGIPGSVGYTALTAMALAESAKPAQRDADPAIGKALDYLLANQKENGSIFNSDRYVNYETSSAVSAFAAAKRSRYSAAQAKARDYLVSSQVQGDPKDLSYGGFPYVDEDPGPVDLSNMQFAVDALAASDLPKDHALWQRVQAYLKRVQNRSEGSDLKAVMDEGGEKKTVVAGDDGGAGYAPGVGKVPLVKRADGNYEVRSYGSMTYALLKCLLLSGVDVKDPRMLAALGWIGAHYTLERNPGFESEKDPAKAGQQGLFYYFFTLAKTLDAYETVTKAPLTIRDADGQPHEWRKELAERLLGMQQADGGWKNAVAERWDEGSRTLATSYAVSALATAASKLK